MRKNFSLSTRVKSMMSAESREQLCRLLQVHYLDALKHWPHDPMIVEIGEDRFKLSESIREPGRVRVEV